MNAHESTASARTWAIFRAGFQATWGRGNWPVGPLILHGSLAALLCGLVRDTLPPFAYALFALSLCGATLALPLLGEFGVLLRADPAQEWIEAQPVRKSELRVARVALVLTLVSALSLASLAPAALVAPDALALGGRLLLVAVGLAQAVLVVAVLLALQSALGERAEALLVFVQTILVVGVVTGVVIVPRVVPFARSWTSIDAAPAALAAWPSAWFASVASTSTSLTQHTMAWGAFATALLLLGLAPFPPAPRARRTRTLMSVVLAPAHALATRFWVRKSERGVFDLVYRALPLEREFVLRTYPMFGIPLAFLVAGANDSQGGGREGLLALLLFSPPIYLPILLAHVPATASPDARWILDTAPIERRDVFGGSLKAVALRFLLPLYAALFVLACLYANPLFAVRIALPAALVGLLVLRQIMPMFLQDPPLSISAQDVKLPMDWLGAFGTLAVVLVFVAIAANAWITSVWIAAAVTLALVICDRVIEARNIQLVHERP